MDDLVRQDFYIHHDETVTDKTYMFDEIDPETGYYTRAEMQDVSEEYINLLGSQQGLMSMLLYNCCSNPSMDTELAKDGYSVYDVELHCRVFRIVARMTMGEDQVTSMSPMYEVKKVYTIST